jgi:DinB superfamily
MNQIVKELASSLQKGDAHATFEDAVSGISEDILGSAPGKLPYSIWQLVEHIRIAQWDIVAFSRDPHHKSPKWPDEFWPKEKAPSDAKAWKKSLDQIASDRKEFIDLLHKAGEDLTAPLPHGDGQSLFHEAMLIIDHTSYHTAEIILLRRLLGAWK